MALAHALPRQTLKFCFVISVVLIPVLSLQGGDEPKGPEAHIRKDLFGDPLPQDCIARLGSARLRQYAPIWSVAFFPNGKTLAAGSDDGVWLWRVPSGEQVRRLKLVDGSAKSVAVSPDGKIVAAGEWGIYLWDTATGKELRKLEAQEGSTVALAFSPDGKTIVSGGSSGLRAWDVRTGNKLWFQEDGLTRIHSVAFSPDGKWIAASSLTGSVSLSAAATGKEERRFVADKGWVSCLAFSPCGEKLATTAGDTICLWQVTTGKELLRLRGHKRGVYSLAFSPDGKRLISGSHDKTARTWDLATGKECWQPILHEDIVLSVAFSPDGKIFATGGYDQAIRLWDATTGKEIRPPTIGHRGSVGCVAYSPDGKMLATGGEDRTVRLWTIATGEQLRELKQHDDSVKQVAFSPDGKLLASCDQQEIRLQTVSGDKEIWRFTGNHLSMPSIVFSPTGRYLAVADWYGSLRIWKVKTGEEVKTISLADGEGMIVAFASEDELVTATSENRICIWDIKTGKLRRKASPASAMAFSQDGKIIAARDKGVVIQEIEKGQLLSRLDGDSTSMKVAFSPDGRGLVTIDRGSFRYAEVLTGGDRKSFRGNGGQITALAFSPDGKALATARADGTVLVWDLAGDCDRANPSEVAPQPKQLQEWWSDLSSDNAARAYESLCQLRRTSKQSVPFICARLKPIPVELRKHIAELIADLESEDFDVREEASGKLLALGDSAVQPLRQALKENPAAELRRRAEAILKELPGAGISTEQRRSLRAIEILEQCSVAEAQRTLEKLASGAPEALVSQAAKAAILHQNGHRTLK